MNEHIGQRLWAAVFTPIGLVRGMCRDGIRNTTMTGTSGLTELPFDLNVGKVLEHWTVPFAVREIIANAIDESLITGTADPEIAKDSDGRWRIRDYGRGVE